MLQMPWPAYLAVRSLMFAGCFEADAVEEEGEDDEDWDKEALELVEGGSFFLIVFALLSSRSSVFP